MERIRVDGRQVAVVRAGAGRPVVFVHGNSSSSRGWTQQLNGPLQRQHTLIALDLPGHGDSEAVPGTVGDRYSLGFYARWLAEAVAVLGVEDAVLVGHSLGGHIILEAMAVGLLGRARGVFVHGAPPVAGPAEVLAGFHTDHPYAPLLFGGTMRRVEAERLGRALYGSAPVPVDLVEDLLRTHPDARQGLAVGIERSGFGPERAVLNGPGCPIAVLHAADDEFIRGSFFEGLRGRRLWRGQTQRIGPAGHYVQWERPDEFDALLSVFLGEARG